MKTLHLGMIVGIVIIVMVITSYEIVQNSAKTTKLGCKDPGQIDLQYDAKRLAIKQQVESIILAYPETRNLIDDSTYCEFMSTSTLYTQNGTYQVININLNNTKNLVAQVNLRNNSVVLYELFNLTRSSTAK
jgi:hypothetical protein